MADFVGLTLVLSPPRLVVQPALAAGQGVVLSAALVVWWRRGRLVCWLGGARPFIAELVRSPVALGYELWLALSVPPNNWDSLTYHLARVAAWDQHHGVSWIANAPTARMNEYEPLAEQQILFLFVATGSTVLYALPQYLAELAILVAVYGAARRLGFGAARAVCASALFASFSLVALEAVTSQNDLVAASFPAVSACLVLGGAPVELVLAGAALGLGLGVKLTTVLVWPVVALLAARRGRRALLLGGAGLLAGAVTLGGWGYVLNVLHTGRPTGLGGVSAAPSIPGSLHTMLHLSYRLFDLSALSHDLVLRLTYVGDLALLVGALHGYRRGRLRRALLEAVCLSLPFFAPLLVIAGSEAFGGVARLVRLPVRISGYAGGLNRTANEDVSAFGPLGTLALLGLPPLVAAAALRRRVGRDALLLALALPSFIVLVGLTASYNPFLTRFALVPAALTAPLLAFLFSSRAVSAALLAVAAIVLYTTLTKDFSEPYAFHPWGFDEVAALGYTGSPQAATALAAYDRLVPRSACIGAALGTDEPSYVLFGPSLGHRVFFLPQTAPLAAARRDGVDYAVVTTTGSAAWIAGALRVAGWRLESLAGYWELAVAPAAGRALERCASP